MTVPPALREFVRRRAEDRCEYCGIRQAADPFFTFHIEHILAKQHGGVTEQSNLALSCHHCNLRKGPNLTAVDPETGQIVLLFNPRSQPWAEHFAVSGAAVIGLTAAGRATVRLLSMNDISRLHLRDAGSVQ